MLMGDASCQNGCQLWQTPMNTTGLSAINSVQVGPAVCCHMLAQVHSRRTGIVARQQLSNSRGGRELYQHEIVPAQRPSASLSGASSTLPPFLAALLTKSRADSRAVWSQGQPLMSASSSRVPLVAAKPWTERLLDKMGRIRDLRSSVRLHGQAARPDGL